MSEPSSKLFRDDPAAYYTELGAEAERERIVKNIRSRINDLKACTKADNCNELAELMESYIPEWIEGE